MSPKKIGIYYIYIPDIIIIKYYYKKQERVLLWEVVIQTVELLRQIQRLSGCLTVAVCFFRISRSIYIW